MVAELVCGLLTLFALFCKYMHWPGAGLLLVLSLLFLAIIYFPSGFYFLKDRTNVKQSPLYPLLYGLLLAPAPIGLLFKMQYWPGGTLFLLVSVFFTTILLLLLVFQTFFTGHSVTAYFKEMFIRTLVWFLLSFVLFNTSMETLINIQHADDPEMARLKLQHYQDPGNDLYRQQYDAYMDSVLYNQEEE